MTSVDVHRGVLCPVCGDVLDPGAIVCPACAATPLAGGPARLLFYQPSASASDRRHRIATLRTWMKPGVRRGDLAAAAAGNRAILRAAAPVVEVAAGAMEPDAQSLHSLSLSQVPARIPRPFLLLVAVGFGVGGAAGLLGAPLMTGFSPLVALLLCVGAFERARRPLAVHPGRPSDLPAGAEAGAIAALASLAPGRRARQRLSNLLRLARVLARTPEPASPQGSAWRRDLGTVVSAGATVALEVDRLDDVLSLLGSSESATQGPASEPAGGGRGDVGADGKELDPARRGAVDRARATRDRLDEGLVDAESALTRVQARLSEGVLDDSLLGEAARRLESSAERHVQAVQAVEALLARP